MNMSDLNIFIILYIHIDVIHIDINYICINM